MKLPYLRDVEGKTKGDCAEALYAGQTYDTALPQNWLDDIAETFPEIGYGLLLSSYVWLYEQVNEFQTVSRPAPLFQEAKDWLIKYDAIKGTHWHLTGDELI